MRPWQRYALGRILEHDKHGELVWSSVVLTVARGAGKSYLLQALAWWRLTTDTLGMPVDVALMGGTVSTVLPSLFTPLAHYVEDNELGRTRWSAGTELLQLGRDRNLRVVSSQVRATTGLTNSLAIVDEAWSVKRDVVTMGLSHTLRNRRSPQLVLVSTAGDGRSDLLQLYRQEAMETGPRGDTLLLEWSAPPDADPYDERTWLWASPHIDDNKAAVMKELRSAARHAPEQEFRSQRLNQWQQNVDSWIARGDWQACLDVDAEPSGGVVLVDYNRRADGWLGVHVGPVDAERYAVRHRASGSLPDVWAWVRGLGEHTRLYVGADGVYSRTPDDLVVAHLFGGRETRAGIRPTLDAIRHRRLLHDGSEVLTDHVLAAQLVETSVGGLVFRVAHGQPDDLNRLMVAAYMLASTATKGPVLI